MRKALCILSIFAAIWAGAGLLASGYRAEWVLIPVAISAALLLWMLSEPETARESLPHVGRLVMRWSAIEGAAMFVAVTVLQNLHRMDALVPAFAVIVGSHFLPLARGIPLRTYYATGLGMIALGSAGMLLPPVERPLVIGLGCAAILWATAADRLIRAGRRPGSAPGFN